jgi:hypothetical protein
VEVLGCEPLQAVADSGYIDAEQIKHCEDAGITPFVPHPRSTNTKGDFFPKSQFVHEQEQDRYRCPADGILRFHSASDKKQARNYVGVNCAGCALKSRCTNAKARWVTRHQYEEVLDRLAARMKTRPGIMKRRGALAEHPFGIIKAMMGVPGFLCRGLEAVAAEMDLSVTAFNLKRAIAVFGAGELDPPARRSLRLVNHRTSPRPAAEPSPGPSAPRVLTQPPCGRPRPRDRKGRGRPRGSPLREARHRQDCCEQPHRARRYSTLTPAVRMTLPH